MMPTFTISGHVNQYARSSGPSARASAKMNVWLISHIGHIFSNVAAMPCNCTVKSSLTVAKAANTSGRDEQFRVFPDSETSAHRRLGIGSDERCAQPSGDLTATLTSP
jgi:hypothetical protein